MDSQERDLFGNPIPSKRRRGRPRGQASSADEQPRARQLGPAVPPPPGLGDLVSHLKPLHRRLESDLADTLARDSTLQAIIARQCETLSRELGVVVGTRQYLHSAATIIVLKALFLRVAEDYDLFPAAARKVRFRGDLFVALRELAPRLTWADYLEYAIRDLAYLPVAYDLFKETAYELIPPGGEIARALLDTVGNLPDLRAMDTRALGDLYQHLMDPEERKRLAYYPTPDFIIDFLLDRTLEPAIEEFGVFDLRYLDICSGTGHFGVRTYRRLDRHLATADPSLTPLERFERIVENNLFAVDVSEFATRITLFRLFLEGVRLAQREGRDPVTWGADLTFNVYTANSLIKLPRQEAMPLFADTRPPMRELDPVAPWYRRELTHLRVDLHDALAKGFHVINANPPYVRLERQAAQVVAPINGSWQVVDFVDYLRTNYATASGGFDLSVPFAERGLELLVPGGFLGYITSGKFAKQAYGKKIAALLAGDRHHLRFFADLTDAEVFEASTYPALVVLQRPADGSSVPADAPVEILATYKATGGGEASWTALRGLLARSGDAFEPYAGHYTERQGHFRSHPWTLRRGQRDLLADIRAASDKTLADYLERIGEDFQTNADPVFSDYITESFIRRQRLERAICLPCLRDENIRNWAATWHGNRKRQQTYLIATGVGLIDDIEQYPGVAQYLRRYRMHLEARRIYGDSLMTVRKWYEFWWWSANLGVPKIAWPGVVLRPHAYADATGQFLVDHPARVVVPRSDDPDLDPYLTALMNSSLFAYFVARTASRVRQQYYDIYSHHISGFPVPDPHTTPAQRVILMAREMVALVESLMDLHPHTLIRHRAYNSAEQLRQREQSLLHDRDHLREAWAVLQQSVDAAVMRLYQLDGDSSALSTEPKAPEYLPGYDWESERQIELVDYIGDMIEDLFAAQRPPQERPLAPAQIASMLAHNPKFEPLRAVYYGGRPVSAEQFVRECLDSDFRPVPFDPERVLSGRRPKRVDVLHERFFRFDGVDRNLYGWTGWGAEAQANVFLTLARRAQDPLPFNRWVSRLIHLPEEAPDIAEPDLRSGLASLIGNAEPYPYVVMDKE